MVSLVSPGLPVACPSTKGAPECELTNLFVATPLWAKCEDKTHTPKSGNLESFGTPATLKLNSRGQNTLP